MKRCLIASVEIFLVAVVLLLPFPAHAQQQNVIYACAQKATGLTRIVDSSTKCLKDVEMAVSWNMVGPQGSVGPQGQQGPPGGLKVIDSQGNLVGYLLDSDSVIRQYGDDTVSIGMPTASQLPYGATFSYLSTDCSGPRYFYTDTSLIRQGSVLGPNVYYAPSSSLLTVYSNQNVTWDGQKEVYGSCQSIPAGYSWRFGLVVSQPIPIFIPPFRIVQ